MLVTFLEDGGQPASSVADRLVAFMEPAARSLDIAIYDLNLSPELEGRLEAALSAAQRRGVKVRLAYNSDHPAQLVYPPPSRTTPDALARLGVDTAAIPGVPDLMHQKYIVRDAGTASAAVWMGSTNWTTDSWTREENFFAAIDSADLAADYARDFDDLWAHRNVSASGHFDCDGHTLAVDGRQVPVRAFFAPGRGRAMSRAVADAIHAATRRVRICSPVITSAPVLAALSELPSTVDCRLVYDRTQMAQALRQWREADPLAWKARMFEAVMTAHPNASKVTTPYAPGSVHDYMHAKLTVADDIVIAGSYNLSHSGEMNAENVMEIRDTALAELFAGYVDRVFERYR
ncbi:MAG: phospholipase D-like domain-containing protein [Candidatus Dormibacteria bacterium]